MEQTPTPAPSSSAIARYRTAKQKRQIEFNSRQHKGRKAEQAELFIVKLLATQTF
jgi:hypothetical protein